MKFFVLLILALPVSGMAKKLDPSLTPGYLQKSCVQSSREFIKKAENKGELCTCISEKVFARLKRAEDLNVSSKKLILSISNEFFSKPKDTYNEDPLGTIDELFNYIDQCVKPKPAK